MAISAAEASQDDACLIGRLIITSQGEKKESLLNSEDEWKSALAEYFGVIPG